ncbi:Polyribonucleotide nucleotidyltransferase [Methanimicrococcus hongohii]|uniref:Translation initiation factor 2 subunit alpha n=1 Tax=Methanimicrococcus hongohii TaxID=3028295 RepID=A0AA96ZSI2_9EURY|nr:translation initiation factor IF-2 subunit alpha [Methanimicrococcus sp. Hf6]WNY23495.1 Polyribonucleotide nucleotidyltransferase [Methanimicrococcus sp. Hf6]
MKSNDWPESGDYVVCNVTNVTDFGAYVELEEYKEKEGFIHISEIKAGWVKYVRDYIREGQKVVCKVLNVDKNRGHIDLSLKDVNEHQKRTKIQLWKNEQKAEKWIQIAAETSGFDDKMVEELYHDFVSEFGSAYTAFEEAAISGESAFDSMSVNKKMIEAVVNVARENIKDAFVEIAGYVDLTTTAPDGIEIIREALKAAADEIDDEEVRIEVTYVGSPRYRIKVVAPDYKKAEAVLKKASNASIKVITDNGGEGLFNRHIESVKS